MLQNDIYFRLKHISKINLIYILTCINGHLYLMWPVCDGKSQVRRQNIYKICFRLSCVILLIFGQIKYTILVRQIEVLYVLLNTIS